MKNVKEKSWIDYENIGDRITAIGLIFESVMFTQREMGQLSNKGVASEINMILVELSSQAGKDAKELFELAYKTRAG
jgi:hypothetical protein